MDGNGANEYTLEELEELLNDETQPETPPANDDTTEPQNNTDDVSKTKAFAARLRESTEKARKEERDAVAKDLGYESYDDMVTKREKQLLEEKGLDPEQVSPIVEDIVKKRLDSDPRLKELEELRKKQVAEFGKKELAEISKLTNGEITSLAQLPEGVINLWKQKGSLKAAYLELEGEKLITKIRSGQSKGSTDHLQNTSGSAKNDVKSRPLTAAEKQAWRVFHPGISDEELNKKTVNY